MEIQPDVAWLGSRHGERADLSQEPTEGGGKRGRDPKTDESSKCTTGDGPSRFVWFSGPQKSERFNCANISGQQEENTNREISPVQNESSKRDLKDVRTVK